MLSTDRSCLAQRFPLLGLKQIPLCIWGELVIFRTQICLIFRLSLQGWKLGRRPWYQKRELVGDYNYASKVLNEIIKKLGLDLDFEEYLNLNQYLNLKNDIAKLHNFLAKVQFVTKKLSTFQSAVLGIFKIL